MGITLNPGTLLNGNGIDVNSLVAQALAPQNAEVTALQQQQSTLQTQASLLSGMNSDLGNLLTSVQSLSDPLGALTAMAAQSSQPSIVTASAQAGAVAGTHNIVVSTLATQGTLYTDAVATADTSILPSNAQSADLSIQIGGASGTALDIPISAGSNDTLNSLVSYINNQNAGVTATVLNDSTGARLAIFSNSTGTSGAVTVNNNTTALSFNPPVGGTNATFTVDGIPFSSTSNTVSGAIPNVTLNLLAAIPSVPVQVSVASDANQAEQAISTFVGAYNTVVGDINNQFTVAPGTSSEGPLGGDSSLRSLQSSLLTDATFTSGSGQINSLAAIGITMNDDGTLSIDSSQLSSALSSNPSAVLNFFQNTAQSGFANNFASDLQNLTDPSTGILSLDLSQNQAQQTDLGNSISDLQTQIGSQQQTLDSQFAQVSAELQAFPYELQAVQQELGITPPSTSSVVSGAAGGGA